MRLKIQKGHTLEEYYKKYGRLLRKGRLLKIDPKNPAESHLFSSKRQYWEIDEDGKKMIYEIPTRRHVFARFHAAKASTKAIITITSCLVVGAAAAGTTLHFIAPRITELQAAEAKKWVKEHYGKKQTRDTLETTINWDYSNNFGGTKKTEGEVWEEFEGKDINYFTATILAKRFNKDIEPKCFKDEKVGSKVIPGCSHSFGSADMENETLTSEQVEEIIKYSEGEVTFYTKSEDFYMVIDSTIEDIIFGTNVEVIIPYEYSYTMHFDSVGFLKELSGRAHSKNCEVKVESEAEVDSDFLGTLDTTFGIIPSKFAEKK